MKLPITSSELGAFQAIFFKILKIIKYYHLKLQISRTIIPVIVAADIIRKKLSILYVIVAERHAAINNIHSRWFSNQWFFLFLIYSIL